MASPEQNVDRRHLLAKEPGRSRSDGTPHALGEVPPDHAVADPGPPADRPPAPDVRDLVADWLDDLRRRLPPAGWIALAVAVVLVAGAVAVVVLSDGDDARLDPATVPRATPPPTSAPASEPAVLVIHVAGAVVAPGVYHVGEGSRVADAIAAAGGPVGDAEVDRLNLAATLTDGQRVHVPLVGEEIVTVPEVGGTAGPVGPLDINTADVAALESLPGIGPTIASAIIARRTEVPFAVVDDLLDVAGIGPTRLERIRDLVTVR